MGTRHLYLARHGEADAFGELTDTGAGRRTCSGERLARVPVDAVWHSPLPRAVASAHELARHLPDVPVAEAAELVDHVPYVPAASRNPRPGPASSTGTTTPRPRRGSGSPRRWSPGSRRSRRPERLGRHHEVLVTHAYPDRWLVRHALDAPPSRWLGLNSANTALTVIEYRPACRPRS